MEFDYKNIIKSKNRRIKELLYFNDILEKQHIEKMKEIERLKEDNEYLNKVNIELSTEKNRLNNIIKEVREYIENYPTLRYSSMDNSNGNRLTGKLIPTDKILEILDKTN